MLWTSLAVAGESVSWLQCPASSIRNHRQLASGMKSVSITLGMHSEHSEWSRCVTSASFLLRGVPLRKDVYHHSK